MRAQRRSFHAFMLEWWGSRAIHITHPPVRCALQDLELVVTGLSARDEGLQMITAFGAMFMGPQVAMHLHVLRHFASLTEVHLYEMVLQDVGHERRALL